MLCAVVSIVYVMYIYTILWMRHEQWAEREKNEDDDIEIENLLVSKTYVLFFFLFVILNSYKIMFGVWQCGWVFLYHDIEMCVDRKANTGIIIRTIVGWDGICRL